MASGILRDEVASCGTGSTPASTPSRAQRGAQDDDPTGLGMYLTGRSLAASAHHVHRASATAKAGVGSARPGIAWNGTKWVGDVPDSRRLAAWQYGRLHHAFGGRGTPLAPVLNDGRSGALEREAAGREPLHPR